VLYKLLIEMRIKTLVSWSSGKDSAWAFHVLRQDPSIDIVGLVSTVNKKFNRVAIHGVRIDLLKEQAKSLNVPLHLVVIPYPCNNDQYISVMNSFIRKIKKQEVVYFAFGDLFLENIRGYREQLLKGTGITPLFPIWGTSTKLLSQQMLSNGLKAVITCVNPKQMASAFIGREYNQSFLNDLPENIDPCGENGEFHSFAFDGPMFNRSIEFRLGKTIYREGICFKDLLLSKFKNKTD
jgi:uncharacterized protein (TIGR00290 family)